VGRGSVGENQSIWIGEFNSDEGTRINRETQIYDPQGSETGERRNSEGTKRSAGMVYAVARETTGVTVEVNRPRADAQSRQEKKRRWRPSGGKSRRDGIRLNYTSRSAAASTCCGSRSARINRESTR